MANSPQSKKRARQAEARYAVNKARRSRIRTYLRKVEEAIASGDQAAAADALLQADDAAKISFAVKYADRLEKALAKGLIHSAPHNNPELAGLSVVMRLVDESRRACLQATESTPTP